MILIMMIPKPIIEYCVKKRKQNEENRNKLLELDNSHSYNINFDLDEVINTLK